MVPYPLLYFLLRNRYPHKSKIDLFSRINLLVEKCGNFEIILIFSAFHMNLKKILNFKQCFFKFHNFDTKCPIFQGNHQWSYFLKALHIFWVPDMLSFVHINFKNCYNN